jgi:hypothetical protein
MPGWRMTIFWRLPSKIGDRQNFKGNCDKTNLIHDNYVIIASSRRFTGTSCCGFPNTQHVRQCLLDKIPCAMNLPNPKMFTKLYSNLRVA